MIDPEVRQQLGEVSWVLERHQDELLAEAERDPAEAARLHRLLADMDGLVPLSSVLIGVLARVDALRRARG